MKNIITIGRQFGSGGHEIGEILAKRLNIPFYDKKLIQLAEEKSGLSKEAIEKADESATNSFLYAISTGSYYMGGLFPGRLPELPLTDTVFMAQTEVIKAVAQEGPCVIVGRCADTILADREDVVRIFIRAEEADRIERIMRIHNLSYEDAEDLVAKTEKKRASYYNFYAQKKWGAIDNYDLVLNHSKINTEEAVDMIASLLQK